MIDSTHIIEPKYGCCRPCRNLKTKLQNSKTWEINSNNKKYIISTKHKLYILRYTIMSRCYNAKPVEYKYYQGKGIKVYEEWKSNPLSFFQWALDNNWQEGMTIDRIDSDRDYSPDNCQFLTNKANLEKMHRQRDLIGENAPHAKLTLEQVNEIRRLIDLGVMRSRIAKQFNVSPSTIGAIKSKQNWKG